MKGMRSTAFFCLLSPLLQPCSAFIVSPAPSLLLSSGARLSRCTSVASSSGSGAGEEDPESTGLTDDEIYASLKSRLNSLSLGPVSLDSEEVDDAGGVEAEHEDDEGLPFFPAPEGRRRPRDDFDRLMRIQGTTTLRRTALSSGESGSLLENGVSSGRSARDVIALNTLKSLGLLSGGALVLTLVFQAALGPDFIHARGDTNQPMNSAAAREKSSRTIEFDMSGGDLLYDPQDAFLYETFAVPPKGKGEK